MKNISHRIFLFENTDSLSSIGFRINPVDDSKAGIEAELAIFHGRLISIHNNPDLPLNSFDRKLILLSKILARINYAINSEHAHSVRQWLDADTVAYTSTISAEFDKHRTGFIEIASCAGVIRFHMTKENWKEVRYGIDSIKQVTDSLQEHLRFDYTTHFLLPNDLNIPALEKDFLFQLQNEYPHRDAMRCKKFFNDYLARHTKGEKDLEDALRTPLYQVLSNYLGPDW